LGGEAFPFALLITREGQSRQAGRQTGRQAGRQADRQAGRQAHSA